jgi:hypothetical protein
MALNAHKVKVYARLIAIGLVVFAALAFILSNGEKVMVRFLWMNTPSLPMWALILIVAVGGNLVFWALRKSWRAVADVRQLRQEEKTRQSLTGETRMDIPTKGNSQSLNQGGL